MIKESGDSIRLRILVDSRDPITIKVNLVDKGCSGSLNPWSYLIGEVYVEREYFSQFIGALYSNRKFEIGNLIGIREDDKVIGIYLDQIILSSRNGSMV